MKFKEVFGEVKGGRLVNLPLHPPKVPPPRNKSVFFGLISHWFPVFVGLIKPVFLAGGTLGGALLGKRLHAASVEILLWLEVGCETF